MRKVGMAVAPLCSTRRARVLGGLLALITTSACDTSEQLAAVDYSWSSLPEAEQRLADAFTSTRSVVELDASTVLLADPRLREIWKANFVTGQRLPFGREGDGPGEFRLISAVLPATGDSVAIVSHSVPYRISIVSENGRPARTRTLGSFASPMEAAFGFEEFPQLTHADGDGRLYGARLALRTTSSGMMYPDSVPIMRLDVRNDAIDTVATFAVGERGSYTRTNSTPPVWTAGRGIYAAINSWTLLQDGTIVAVDAKNYVLTITRPSGAVQTVPVKHAHPRYRISDKEWERHSDSATRAVGAAMARSFGQMSARMGVSMDAPDVRNQVKPADSPGYWPPVLTSTARILAANDLLWIPVPGPESPRRKYWDVVSLDGTVRKSFKLDEREYIFAVTSGYVYAFRIDDDDLWWISRRVNSTSSHVR